jgi:PAS domain S-box-containing protein
MADQTETGQLELFKRLMDSSGDAIFVNDAATSRFVDVNEQACASLGYTRAELLGLRVMDVETTLPDDFLWQDHVARLRRRGSLLLEGLHGRKDGTTFPVETRVSLVSLGGREAMIAIVRDITERKRAEAALQARERQLAASQRMAHVGSWEHNLATNQVVWSEELFRLLGLNPHVDAGDFGMFFSMVHPEDRARLKQATDETLRLGTPFSLEYRFVLRDGAVRVIDARAELQRDEAGRPVVLSGTAQDITERKQAEEQFRRSEQFNRSILDTVDEGFIVVDREYRILTANRAYCGQVGSACGEIVGRHCWEVTHKATRPCHELGEDCSARHVFASGEPYTALHRHRDAHGQMMFVETKGFPIKDAAGAVTSVIETISNITERHLLEEERLKTQKLESIGTLAGGIAHDFNNLLQGVFGFISLAKLGYEDRERSLAMLAHAEAALQQSVTLTTQLLTFSKGGRPVKKRISLLPVIESAARFALSGSRSTFHLQVEPGLQHVEADEGQIGQVIQNIVLNADQAMERGGSVLVAARNVPAPEAAQVQGLEAGPHVLITIRDSGAGIPEQDLPKIFDPYFTTKEKGSGLGLATSYSIVRNHGGRIRVESKIGVGTTFFLYLPASDSAAVEAPRPAPAPPTRRGRVLVMDDEDVVRDVAGQLLREIGHDAAFAETGEAALAAYRAAQEAGTPFDAVILDLTVRGGWGGVETVQKLREIDPGVKAVVSSGYADDATLATYRQQGFLAALKKPYGIRELQEVLHPLIG